MTFTGPDQVVSSTEKMKLLGFLRRTHGKDEKPAEAAAPEADHAQAPQGRRDHRQRRQGQDHGQRGSAPEAHLRQARPGRSAAGDRPSARKSCASWRNRKRASRPSSTRSTKAIASASWKRSSVASSKKPPGRRVKSSPPSSRRCAPMRPTWPTELRTDKHAPRPHKADMPRAEPKSPAPSRPPLNKSPANAPATRPRPSTRPAVRMPWSTTRARMAPRRCSSPASCT